MGEIVWITNRFDKGEIAEKLDQLIINFKQVADRPGSNEPLT